jgi:hypothetical protein
MFVRLRVNLRQDNDHDQETGRADGKVHSACRSCNEAKVASVCIGIADGRRLLVEAVVSTKSSLRCKILCLSERAKVLRSEGFRD